MCLSYLTKPSPSPHAILILESLELESGSRLEVTASEVGTASHPPFHLSPPMAAAANLAGILLSSSPLRQEAALIHFKGDKRERAESGERRAESGEGVEREEGKRGLGLLVHHGLEVERRQSQWEIYSRWSTSICLG